MKAPRGFESWEEQARYAAEEIQDQATRWAAKYDIELDTETTVGVPHKQILTYVVDHDVDHVVMGSHSRSGLSRVFLGSVAEAVAQQSSIPVTIVRD